MSTNPSKNLAPPSWFQRALDVRPTRFDVEVEGCRIACRSWGEPGLPVLVLVHGGGAHSGWWDHIAPFFAATHHVVAPDLSGHGDSETRSRYGLGVWSREVLAVAAAANPSIRPVIVGHSMGGWVTGTAATRDGAKIDGIVVLDSPLRDRAPEADHLRRVGRHEGHLTREAIVSRFRPVPGQEVILPFIANHIAIESVRRKGLHWRWKFDPAIFQGRWVSEGPGEADTMEHIFAQMPCRIAYLRCEYGSIDVDMANRIREMLQLRGPFIELPEAGHHPMLDQPLSLVSTLRALLEMWSIS
ncbi:alpha/beta fold hydrolase [[Mycobacterium] burgundiense]|uniref:Alpha/beta hydrolase n=1 Tax=[Mycobacterium] burgundiense TaxID=3064286 RepID=A0ABM9M3W7_9MYCO|nr:alpha/beta hydrolase [Mycolicibacterium sp. MU0053]CAJ1509758.1 alpha/beta hydrolase [Mycolicibacterium sp. MU0053]